MTRHAAAATLWLILVPGCSPETVAQAPGATFARPQPDPETVRAVVAQALAIVKPLREQREQGKLTTEDWMAVCKPLEPPWEKSMLDFHNVLRAIAGSQRHLDTLSRPGPTREQKRDVPAADPPLQALRWSDELEESARASLLASCRAYSGEGELPAPETPANAGHNLFIHDDVINLLTLGALDVEPLDFERQVFSPLIQHIQFQWALQGESEQCWNEHPDWCLNFRRIIARDEREVGCAFIFCGKMWTMCLYRPGAEQQVMQPGPPY